MLFSLVRKLTFFVPLVVLAALSFTRHSSAAPPITLQHQWTQFADPGGIGFLDQENGITDAESTQFDLHGKLIITASKADGRITAYNAVNNPTRTAHLRLFDTAGNLIWDRGRSRGPLVGGFPSDQPTSDRADEIEVALFSPDGRFVAAGGEDDKIEIWRVREDHHGANEWLAAPVLVKTFHTGDGNPNTNDAAIDGMTFSRSGDLLFAGTEQAGKVEVFRVQGDPSTWQHMHQANHGGSGGQAVNSVDISSDDGYVASAGTNSKGVFWRLDLTRDANDLITSVNMVKLATLNSENGQPISGSGREARFEKGTDRHVSFSFERGQAIQVYDVQQLIAYGGVNSSGPAPIQTLRNHNVVVAGNVADGNQVEPIAYTNSGRFLIADGDTTDGVFPGFFRIYETAEIQPGMPEPDPVYMQRALSTEYFDFSPDDTMLASGHGDGTVRLWNVNISGSKTIYSEAFNESTATAGRWTLGVTSGTLDTGEWGSSSQVTQNDSPIRGHRGSQYIAADNLQDRVHQLTLNQAWDISGFTQRQVQFAAVAADGVFEAGDFLRLRADLNGGTDFETIIAEFLPDAQGDLALGGNGGPKLSVIFNDDNGADLIAFQDFFIDLEPFLSNPIFDGTIRFRIEARNSNSDEEIGFDSLRVTAVPEPATMLLAAFGLFGLLLLRHQRAGCSYGVDH